MDGDQGVVEGQGGAVLDAFVDGVFVVDAVGVGGVAEGLEGALAHLAPVHGGAGEAEEEGIGQGRPHVDAQVALLGTVGLVHQHHHVAPGLDGLGHAVKLMDGGDDHAPAVVAQGFAQMTAALGPNGVQTKGFHILQHLGLQLQPVHDDQDGGVEQSGVTAQKMGGHDHGEGFAGPLGVGFQTGAGFVGVGLGGDGPLHDLLHGPHLVGTQEVLLQGVVHAIEEGVVSQQTQDLGGVEEAFAQIRQAKIPAVTVDRDLPFVEGFGAGVPGGPIFQPGGADGEGDRVLDEFGDLLGVGGLHLVEALQTGVLDAGGFVLDQEDGQAVDKEDHVHASPVPVHKPHLLGEVEEVGPQVVEVDEGDVALSLGAVVVGGPVAAQGVEELLVAVQGGGQQAQTTHQGVDAGVVLGPAVEGGQLAAQDGDQEWLFLVVAPPGGQVVTPDEGPADVGEEVDQLVLDVTFFGDAGHGGTLFRPRVRTV